MKSLKFQHFFIFLILFFAISCQDNQEVSPTIPKDLQEHLDVSQLGIDLNKTVTFDLKGLDQGLIKIKGKPFANNIDQIEAVPLNSRLSFNYVTTSDPPGIITVIPILGNTHDYLSATNSKTILNIDNLSGWILKRDLNGNFIEGLTFENGVQLGTLEDPSGFPLPINTSSNGSGDEPEDRLHCYEVTTTDWSRTCWYQDGSFIGCDSWSVTGSSTEEQCFTEPDGGGGGSGGGSGLQVNNYEERVYDDPDFNMDCASFQFQEVAGGDYQACGVLGIQYDHISEYPDAQGRMKIEYFAYQINLYFEMPKRRVSGVVISPGLAAEMCAKWVTDSEEEVEDLFEGKPPPMAVTFENKFIDAINSRIIPFGGRCTRTSRYGLVPVNHYQKTAFGYGNCQ